ncbi:MAG: ABC transporter ATP-binding protein [Solirubrobacterales bacterium]|nr:ABC transporter ATP-binding protein [Solirubrobacterales bacterium]
MSSSARAATPGQVSPAARAGSAEEILAVEHIHVQLGAHMVLDDVSFAIRAGEFTGLIGANGAGKTTLFRVVLGLTPASGGAVRVAGGARSRRNPLIGYVPQKFLLDPDMPLRARDLVALGIDAHRFGIARPSRARRERAEQMLAAVDALEFAERRVGLLSGGEQQRVLIAHALIGRPRLLLADEPLANLDLRSAEEVVALLARIAREQRIAVLISAHEINPLLPVMDRVVYLAAGRAVSGSADEVVRSDVLSRLYGHHVDVLHVHGRVIVVAGAGEDLAGHELRFPEAESGA